MKCRFAAALAAADDVPRGRLKALEPRRRGSGRRSAQNDQGGGYSGSQPAWLRCDISSGLKPKPSRPKGCEFDFAGTLTLSATGRARIGCVSDVVLPDPTKARVLAYGTSWHYGPFTCKSAKTGLSCRNSAGHGFFLSRASWKRL
jgi:hypothetical protein